MGPREVEGIQLDKLEIGKVYELATALGCFLLCEGLAELVGDRRTKARSGPLPPLFPRKRPLDQH